MKDRHLIVIAGPTAVGKTSLSIRIAKELKTEILSADSRQFFREMNIGTAKPSTEEMEGIPHHFIDNRSIDEDSLYNAGQFESESLDLLEKLFIKHRQVILTGGSGLYINALCHGFDDELPPSDPEIREMLNKTLEEKGITALQEQLQSLDPDFYKKIDLHNPNRLIRAIEVCLITGAPYSSIRKGKKTERPFNMVKIGLELPREELYTRINERVDQMILKGLEDEVRSLLPYSDRNALKTVGYQEIFEYFYGNMSREEAIEKIKINTRRYAKRQLTWFKKDLEYSWFHPEDYNNIIRHIMEATLTN